MAQPVCKRAPAISPLSPTFPAYPEEQASPDNGSQECDHDAVEVGVKAGEPHLVVLDPQILDLSVHVRHIS
jgi:hypothetical protein